MTEEDLKQANIDEMKNDIFLSSKRLCLLLKYFNFKDINLTEKIIICDFINEMAYNVKIQTENVINNI